jgi:hypothetical protein
MPNPEQALQDRLKSMTEEDREKMQALHEKLSNLFEPLENPVDQLYKSYPMRVNKGGSDESSTDPVDDS